MSRQIVEQYGIEREKVRTIPNYVDTRRFTPSASPSQTNQILYVGRLSEEKNVEALLEAVDGLPAELVLVGGGPLKEHLEAKGRKGRSSARFVGRVPNGRLPEYLNRASVFVLPSLIEHHPKALLEAMACGVPVIGTDVSGIRELIEHGQTGYLCDPSPGSIQEAIAAVMANEPLRARLGKNARQFVIENFALEKVVDMELALLEELAP